MEIIVISFIVTQTLFIFWLFVLTLKVNKLKENLTENSRMKKEMEQLFESYLMDMRMENETLLKQLASPSFHQSRTVKSNHVKSQDRMTTRHNHISSMPPSFGLDEMIAQMKSKDSMHIQPPSNEIDKITYKKPVHVVSRSPKPDTLKDEESSSLSEENDRKIPSLTIGTQKVDKYVEKEEVYAQSLTAQALLLKEQGFSLDEIARQLNKGKTELELLLKFRQ